jgi:hypothetical protein
MPFDQIGTSAMSLDAAVVISALALIVSIVTLWLTHLRVGVIKLTQPSQIYLGPDGGSPFAPKVFIRTLLYSTSSRGRCLENMFVKLKRGETSQNFSIWVHGSHDSLTRASGILVGPNGIDHAHHFLLPPDSNFQFQSGRYEFELDLRTAGEKRSKLAYSRQLDVSDSDSKLINSTCMGLYYDWGPDSQSYQKHVRPTKSEIVVPALAEECGAVEEGNT